MKTNILMLLLLILFNYLIADANDSNIEIVGRMIEIKNSSINQFLTGYQGKTILLLADGTNDANDVVISYLQSILQKSGQSIKVITNAQDASSGITMRVKIIDINIGYSSKKRKYFIGKQVVKRVSKLTLLLSLTNPDGNIIATSKIISEINDELPLDTALLYQNSNYKFSNPKLPESHSSILEPIVVTGIVGTLIYIFYANKEK